MTPKTAYPGTQSVRRAFALLKAFSDARPELGLSELAQTAGLNKSTAYRLLTALESEGFVARSPDSDAYRLGPEVVALAGRALRANDLPAASRPELEALTEATGETATLEILSGDHVLILEESPGKHLVGTAPSIGSRWPAHATSTGKVLLAYLPQDKRRELLQKPLPRIAPRTKTGLKALEAEYEHIRREGFAKTEEELESGFSAVGAPVRDHSGQVVAAVSVGGPSSRLSSEQIPRVAKLVIAAADRISTRLGHRPARSSSRV